MSDSAKCYPDRLITRLTEEWKPPHRSSFGGKEFGVPFRESAIREFVEQTFFASLRAEEGRYLRQGVVLSTTTSELELLKWDLSKFSAPIDFASDALAKLSPALGSNRYLVVCPENDRLAVVGIGQANDGPWLFAEDHYPRIRTIGPADLVFCRGNSVAFRYRAGDVIELEHDFLSASGEPASAVEATMRLLFAHRNGAVDSQELDMVRHQLAELIEAVSASGHGGMLAVLASMDSDETSLLSACDYRIAPIEFGGLMVEMIEGAQQWNSIEQEVMAPPEYEQYRPYTDEELAVQRALEKAELRWQRTKDSISGVASVDGAVLVNAKLSVLGFGCKLPRENGGLPNVLKPTSDGSFGVYDLSKRGTRHAAAAQFADRPGRFAITISADGPVGCFIWSETLRARVYWPVFVGTFAPHRW